MRRKLKCVDLFAGCGGLSLGLENAGIKVVSAYENWKPAIEVYKKNFKHPVIELDLSKLEESVESISQFSPDIIVGGPPCQDFSSAGKRDLNGGRADLTYSYADIVTSIKPEWFVMENVEQIKKSHILTDVISDFIEAGYGLTAVILDASYCTVPQARTRFFLIGHLNDMHQRLIPFLQGNLSKSRMTVREYLGNQLEVDYYYRHPRNYNRRGIFSICLLYTSDAADE